MSCGCTDPCQPNSIPCTCEARVTSDCVTVSGATSNCLAIDDNLLLTDYLTQMDERICEKVDSVTNFIALENVGTGSQLYKGDSLLGKKQIRTVKSIDPNLVVTQTDDEIQLDLNIPAIVPPSAHTHTKSQITDFAHTHPISDVTGLPMALDDLQLNKENVANKSTDFTTVNNTLYPSVQAVKNEIINSKNYVSVKDFGATGNGVTDDTPAINSALTYCETINGTLFFPSGNYLTTGNFIINSKISIKGEGESLNIITNPLPTVFNAGS